MAQEEIAERTEAEKKTREALAENEILLKEVHHRVKNNLQVISSLLNLQAVHLQDEPTVDLLRESQNRVRSMALIHEKLSQSNDLAHVEFGAYLQSLVYSLAQTYKVESEKVSLQVETDQIYLDIDSAIPCGLIVNELVSNSIKYAFPEGRTGVVGLSYRANGDGRFALVVEDDGIGLPGDFDWQKSQTLGLKLVSSLVRQIGGVVEVDAQSGARFTVTFGDDNNS